MGPALSGAAGVAERLRGWEADHTGVVLVRGGAERPIGAWGEIDRPFDLASVTKVVVALGCLVAIEEGAIALDDPAGPRGSTVRHLLTHASGLDHDSTRAIVPPATRRIYSNTGFEVLADHLAAATGMAWTDYVAEAVLDPLAMTSTTLGPSAARGASGSASDLAAIVGELLRPTLVDPGTVAAATVPVFGELDGVLPGFGPQKPCPWGLGFEIRGHKHPHWTGSTNSARTFGHFGASGTFLWVDPELDAGAVALGDRPFGPWAAQAWPPFNDALVGLAR